MKLTTRVLVGILGAGIIIAPAAAQVLGPVPVFDAQSLIRLIQQVQQQATMLQNEARNLAKLPNLNMGNIQGEVQSVSAQANNIPAQIRGIVSANQVLVNAPTDAARTAQINAAAAGADGAVQQQQVSNQYLGQINDTLQQKNAADAAKEQQNFANTADGANSLLTITGNGSNPQDTTPNL
jgi:protein gp37